MASFPQIQNSQNHISESCDYDMFGFIINHLHQEFNGSLDLNYPNPILKSTHSFLDLSSQPLQSKPIFKNQNEARCSQKESKKRRHMEIEHEEHKMIHDLKLRLSPPGINPKDESASANQLENSQSESNESSESDENLVGLVLMGCTKCHIYVMVCEVEPKCPNCKNSFLIDIFQHNTLPNTKRSKGC